MDGSSSKTILIVEDQATLVSTSGTFSNAQAIAPSRRTAASRA